MIATRNHRPEAGSKRTLGSERYVHETEKNVQRFVVEAGVGLPRSQIRISRFTASTIWNGPAATWVSGGYQPPLSDCVRPCRADPAVIASGVPVVRIPVVEPGELV